MTYVQRVLDFLWSIAPDGATNDLLPRRLGIRSQQTVYMLTQQLMATGRIHGERSGATWVFHAAEGPGTGLAMGPPWTNDTVQATGSEAGQGFGPGRGRRTVQQLLTGAAQRTEAHKRAAAERAEQERQRQDRERATARARVSRQPDRARRG